MPESGFEIFRLDGNSILSFSGPFEIISRRYGRQNALKEIGLNPEKAAVKLSRETDRIIDSIQSLLDTGKNFKAAWIWSDLAHKNNLFFSPEYYKKNLLPLHKKLIGFLNSHNMSVIFHSDGKIDCVLPYLLEAGVKAFYPVDEYADMEIDKYPCLKRRFPTTSIRTT